MAGTLTLTNLKRSDFGFYECHVSNEVATLVAKTHLVIEGTTPHAPQNITTESTEFSVSLEWLPGYSGGSDYIQNYVIWYDSLERIVHWLVPFDSSSKALQVAFESKSIGSSARLQIDRNGFRLRAPSIDAIVNFRVLRSNASSD